MVKSQQAPRLHLLTSRLPVRGLEQGVVLHLPGLWQGTLGPGHPNLLTTQDDLQIRVGEGGR